MRALICGVWRQEATSESDARAKLGGQCSSRCFLMALPANADHLCLAIN
jgi:hypothetical protein